MLDHVSIFSQSGTVLWSRSLCQLRGNPVDELVKTVLLEERTGRKELNYDAYQMRWTLENKLNLVLVVVYQKVLQLLYVDELLERLKQEVVASFIDEIRARAPIAFDDAFDRILRDVETSYMKGKHMNTTTTSTRALPTSKKNGAARADASSDPADKEKDDSEGVTSSADELDRLKHDMARLGSSKSTKTMRTGPRPSKFKKNADKPADDKNKGTKKPALSYTIKDKISAKDMAKLDQSKPVTADDEQAMLDTKRRENIGADTMSDDENESESEQSGTDGSSGWSFGQTRLGDFLQKVSGNKMLTRDDLAPVMDQFRQTLIAKNVATEVAEELCESVMTTMIGKRLESFTRIQTVVQKALETALLRILTPKKSTDVLREVLAAREAGRCYSIVFVGVNGVGKSTSLSKVCYYLKSRGVKVMIAACDTFRSGAVEQLNQHCKVLDVPLFERGYAKDPAAVARDAVAYGNDNGFDCVLIDTAGRMQNNEPLMRALAKLVSVNNPDLVLFVGEALVGNDGIDQLSLFDRALVDYSDRQDPRRVDGIVITKFDTIDDKVGAAVSMVYKTGQPIMFVGTGQKYTNLTKLNIKTVMRSLLS
ncbi:fused signal recognition particle receptor [Saprolegnia diclina VS20]|uniref:Fused signal recognition particle receptor n=1 Tax=Saprolegnia diclina (strain VS20) TaxID=1156394 RepID=T0QHD4_SAPDV|nr:fused signal recognition particle receptor [Saprolegnia diclina VS20]EQC33060.1 fused signal recognition particle receptor [Saprolegnia diclina VS20]|eukprot:XP_008613746.1 fused signal recognition particle receptor [Saprolegnia diclina VS20]